MNEICYTYLSFHLNEDSLMVQLTQLELLNWSKLI